MSYEALPKPIATWKRTNASIKDAEERKPKASGENHSAREWCPKDGCHEKPEPTELLKDSLANDLDQPPLTN